VESVKIEVYGDAKTGFILVGSIAANGGRLPLVLIAKGVTAGCHKQFGRLFPGNIDYSKSSWVNRELFLRFLSFIRSNCGMSPIALIVNQYSAHMSPLSHAQARELGIKLILIPKGGTDCYQPRDRWID
jgi:hypothetical protein